MLQKPGWLWHSKVVLALASLWYKVLLAYHLLFKLSHQSELFVVRVLIILPLGFC